MKIYLAGHGDYGVSTFKTLKFFKNDIENIGYMVFDNSYEEKMEAFIRANEGEDLLVVTDLLGGSVTACAMQLLRKYHFRLVAGVNLAFLLEIVFQEHLTDSIIESILEESKKQTLFVNDLLGSLKND